MRMPNLLAELMAEYLEALIGSYWGVAVEKGFKGREHIDLSTTYILQLDIWHFYCSSLFQTSRGG